jgi:alpha-glucosidase
MMATPPCVRYASCLAKLGAAFGVLFSVGTGAVAADKIESPKWWSNAVIYEIYPRSFQDSDGDGVGDLNGITQRLGYLESLGVDAIWIAPMFPSPQVDFGYDVSDYENIDPQYGSLADFDRLVASARRHHIRVVLDMVLNHTSDKHPWFLASASSRSDAKHDYYVWSDGRKSQGAPLPPNNWVSLFGGSSWQYVQSIQQFYYHKFYAAQPDLNWRNPAVEKAMFDAMRFWLKRGVAGFRLDAITTLFEDPRLRDEPAAGGKNLLGDPNLEDIYTNNLPAVHGVIKRMRRMTDGFPGDRVLIGETYLPNTAELDKWYGGTRQDELQLPMDMLVGFSNKLDAANFRRLLTEVETQVHGGEPMLVFDNHDNPRSWDRYGDGRHNAEIAKLIAAVLLTSRASALLYQGEEIGQVTAAPTRVEDVKDPIGVRGWPKEKGRDGERTPMQWDAGARAGFSSNPKTWLPVTSNYRTVNVQSESADRESLLSWHRQLIALRRTHPALKQGRMLFLDTDNPHVLTYARVAEDGSAVLVALNMSADEQTPALDLDAAGVTGGALKTLMATPGSGPAPASGPLSLAPFGAWLGTR